MEYIILIIILILIAFFVGVLITYTLLKKQDEYLFSLSEKSPKNQSIQSHYLNALTLIEEKKTDVAIKELTFIATSDTGNVDLYFLIAKMYRSTGLANKSVHIHDALMTRYPENISIQFQARLALVQDYQSLGLQDRALDNAKKLVQMNAKSIVAWQTLESVAEQTQTWDIAIQACQQLQKLKQPEVVLRKSFYMAKYSDSLIGQQDIKKAKKWLLQANEGKSRYAQVQLVKWFLNTGSDSKAFRLIQDIFLEGDELSIFLITQTLLDAFQDKQISKEWIERLLEKNMFNDDLNMVHYAKLKLWFEIGAINHKLCKNVWLSKPHVILKISDVWSIIQSVGEYDLLQDMLNQLYNYVSKPNHKLFACSKCHYESNIHDWKCPQCLAWQSYEVVW